jgi:hypothetical protein
MIFSIRNMTLQHNDRTREIEVYRIKWKNVSAVKISPRVPQPHRDRHAAAPCPRRADEVTP